MSGARHRRQQPERVLQTALVEHLRLRGRGGNSEYRQSNKFFLTFAHSRESRQSPPTHDWRKIKTLEEAIEIAQGARDNKNPRAVQFAENRAKKTKHRYRKPVVAPHPENR